MGKPRGMAAIPAEKRRAIASAGGKAAHAQGVAHEFTSEEAKAAGRKGGATTSRNREHMAEIGRRGGLASRKGARAEATVPAAQAAELEFEGDE